jgi:hypothetical protein
MIMMKRCMRLSISQRQRRRMGGKDKAQISNFHNPFEGQLNSDIFSRNPYDKSVLTEY